MAELNAPSLPLRDIHLPAEIGWWPPAPGWWALLIMGLSLSLWLARFLYLRHRRHRPIKAALDELTQLESDYEGNIPALAGSLSRLLRRLAITEYGREAVASLSGDAWVQFLQQTAPAADIPTKAITALASLPYQPNSQSKDSDDIPALIEAARCWIKHQNKARPYPSHTNHV